jgi:ubiquinone/menaquinone biosynthesis C-methylase UbiE
MTEWHSYDSIADIYDRIWGPRFGRAARELLERVRLSDGSRVLDVGTGTGIVPAALDERLAGCDAMVGVDISAPMLARAHSRVPLLHRVAADAQELPFRSETFDAVTFNFVLSHVPDYARALREAGRVAVPGGILAVSNWGAGLHASEALWSELLQAELGKKAMESALGGVAPCEEHFRDPGRLRSALADAGLQNVRVDTVDVVSRITVEEFLADRELSSFGRYGRHHLGEAAWQVFRKRAIDELRRRFGGVVTFGRPVLVATGVRP